MAKKKAASNKKTEIIIAEGAVVVPMTPTLRKQIDACLKRSGTVTIGFEEIAITKIPGTGTASVVTD
jgi:hypothetical protein